MANKVISFFFVASIAVLGFGALFTSTGFITPALAQVSTINDLSVDGESEEINVIDNYDVSFRLGGISLQPGGSVNIVFNSPFSVSASTSGSSDGFSCVPPDSAGKITCTRGLTESSISDIHITVFNIKNPGAEGNYPVSVTMLGGPSGSYSVAIMEPTSSGGGDDGGFPKFGKCTWRLYDCLKSLVTYVPEVIIALVVGAIRAIIGVVMAALIAIGWLMIKFSVFMNDWISANGSAAQIGFDIALDFANIGFVMAIILIAFATILRQRSFAIEAALPRLIIIAVLINFSWFFATTLINISTRLGNGLLEIVMGKVWGDVTGAGKYFTSYGNIDLKEILPSGVAESFLSGALEFLIGIINGLVSIIVQLLFGLVTFFALISTAMLLLVRYIALSLLLILMPLALVTHIFPNLNVPGGGGYWSKWTGQFSKWLIFYPAVMFFIGIALRIQDNLPVDSTNPLSSIGSALAAAGILLGGLLVSTELGLQGAKTANQIGTWATRKIAISKPAGMIGRRLLGERGSRGLGLAGAGAGAPGEPGAEGAQHGRRLNLAPAIRTAGGIREEGISALGGIVRRVAPTGGESPLERFGLTGAGTPGEGAARESLESRLAEPVAQPTPESSDKSLKETLKGIPPSWRERAGAGMLKYAEGGQSLGSILVDAVKTNAGIFKDFGSIEGYSNLEKKMKGAEGVLGGLEARINEPNKIKEDIEKMLGRQLKMEGDLEKLNKKDTSTLSQKELENHTRRVERIQAQIGELQTQVTKKETKDLPKAEDDSRKAQQQMSREDIKVAKQRIEAAKKDFNPELRYKKDKKVGGDDKKDDKK